MEDNKAYQKRLLCLQIEFEEDADCGEIYSILYADTNITVFPNKAKANSRRQVLLTSKRRNTRWSVPTFDKDFYKKFESNLHLDDLYFRANSNMSSVDAFCTNPDTNDECGNRLSTMSLRKLCAALIFVIYDKNRVYKLCKLILLI